MAVTIGPADWWVASPTATNSLAISCPVGTTLPDGSRIICKAGGTAWIVAPCTTQVSSAWAGGQYNSTQVGAKCCICEWPALNTLMLNCGFNPCDWFIPNTSQISNPGYVCRCQWDSFPTNCSYWTSSEATGIWCAIAAFFLTPAGGCILSCSGGGVPATKPCTFFTRAFRCVTY